MTGQGRAAPLVWKTVHKDELKGRRDLYEDEVRARFAETLPAGVQVTVTGDRRLFESRWLDALQPTAALSTCPSERVEARSATGSS